MLAYLVNELGSWAAYVALALAVYDHTHSALATAALFIARGLVPALLAPVLVVRMERTQTRGALSSLFLVEVVLALGLAGLLLDFSLPGLLVLVAIDGVAAIAAAALTRAAGARIAEEDEADDLAAQRANASLNSVFTIAFAFGPAAGGLLVSSVGAASTLAFDAVTFLACALLLLDLPTHVHGASETSLRHAFGDAVTHVRELPALRTLLVAEALALVLFASTEPVEVIYARRTLEGGNIAFGLIVGCWGVGAALGSILFARVVTREIGRMLTFGTLLLGLGYLGFAVAPTVPIACVAALVGGVGNGFQWPALIGAVQAVTPPALQGRMMSVVGSLGALFPNVGYPIGGAITVLASTRVAMLCAGALAR
ncbi:MAG: MFS transporter, partial [Solirubrobacteraceae bacterium]